MTLHRVTERHHLPGAGSMKPERFKDSDADFNLGMAVAATSFVLRGTVVVCITDGTVTAEFPNPKSPNHSAGKVKSRLKFPSQGRAVFSANTGQYIGTST